MTPPERRPGKGRARTRRDYRALVHELNQRYRAAWDRAERLEAELRDIRASRAWRVLSWVRSLKRALRLSRPTAAPGPADFPALVNPPGPPSGRVSIIIPFKDRSELLRGCLRSLRRTCYRAFEVVLVDNGSTAAATRRLLRRCDGRPRYRIVPAPGPFNFSRLCNLGASRAAGDYLLFLNNDTEAIGGDWLEELLATAAHPQVGAVGATLLYPDHTLQHAGVFPAARGAWTHAYRGRPEHDTGDRGELRHVRAVPAVTGACLLIRRRLFGELGGFDERYPVTFGDVDLCLRVRAAGLHVAVTPHARLYHFESLSRGYSRDEPAGALPAAGEKAL